MLRYLRICLQYFLIILAAFNLASCGRSLSKEMNKKFVEKYQADVDRINSKRGQELSQHDPKIRRQFGSVSTQNTGLPSSLLPDNDTYIAGKNSSLSLPDYMFDIDYVVENTPYSYGRAGIDFDEIIIPPYDAYGIDTDLGDKNYLMVGNRTLQRNIDTLNTRTSRDDREISLIIIKEQKELSQRKRLGLKKKAIEEKKVDEDENPDKKSDEKDPANNKKDAEKKDLENQENPNSINNSNSNKPVSGFTTQIN